VRALHARARRVIDAVVGATLVLLGARLLASR
jgi:threonine/homoserine/homoserine lactone efflux protein